MTKQTLSMLIIGILLLGFFGCSKEQKKQPEMTALQVQGKACADLPKEIVGKDGAQMVLIPAGEFQMEGNAGKDDEKTVYTVYIDAFYIDKYEVTNAQYRRFVQATGHREPRDILNNRPWSGKNFSGDNQPVVSVSWEDAKAYCEWAGKRLPTDAEWGKAARGGLEGMKYVWGDDWPPPRGAGNFRIEGYADGYSYPAPVGSFDPNGYGLYDMAGNVSEWCADWFALHKDYYSGSPRRNPSGPSSGTVRVTRGGSWGHDEAHFLRVAYRGLGPKRGYIHCGFRCVVFAQDLVTS
jgi:iron(II)-dependent oxidoreductase